MSETHFEPLSPEEAALIGYERSEPNSRKIALLTISIVVTIIIVCFFVYWWYVLERERAFQREFAIPVWEVTKEVRAYETERLTQYKYIDKAKGAVQLPIDKAMEIYAAEAAEGKFFHNSKASALVPYEPDPGLQDVLNRALGKPVAPPAAAAPAAGAPVAPTTPTAPAH
ncbi:MAG: hypothetical protein NW208_02375 [Bryobacter sp.]|nr:hypothetical protein [Bryobacter sp.]